MKLFRTLKIMFGMGKLAVSEYFYRVSLYSEVCDRYPIVSPTDISSLDHILWNEASVSLTTEPIEARILH